MVWVGVDVGKTRHHACAIDMNGKTVFSQRFANDQTAIERLVALAGEAAIEVRWAID